MVSILGTGEGRPLSLFLLIIIFVVYYISIKLVQLSEVRDEIELEA
jgi:hypothetical protein